MQNPWIKKNEKLIYENNWISVREDSVINPNGENGIYGVVNMKNIAVAILPVDDNGYTYLVGQYRYPLDKYEWEIPEGGCPKNETPLQCAKRELKEETGIIAKKWTPIFKDIQQSNSVTSEISYAFKATNLEFGTPNPENTEVLKIKKVHLSTALDMVLNGKIKCSVAVATILFHHCSINK